MISICNFAVSKQCSDRDRGIVRCMNLVLNGVSHAAHTVSALLLSACDRGKERGTRILSMPTLADDP